MYIPMSQMHQNTTGIVKEILIEGEMRRRIQDLGLIPSTKVVCLHHAPSGSPTAFLIRGAVIALRKRDTHMILVEMGE